MEATKHSEIHLPLGHPMLNQASTKEYTRIQTRAHIYKKRDLVTNESAEPALNPKRRSLKGRLTLYAQIWGKVYQAKLHQSTHGYAHMPIHTEDRDLCRKYTYIHGAFRRTKQHTYTYTCTYIHRETSNN